MAWMWWTLGIVAVGLAVRVAVDRHRRPAGSAAVGLPPLDRVRLAQLDEAIAAAASHVAVLERDGAPVAQAGPLTLGTHRVAAGGRGLDIGPGLRVSVELVPQATDGDVRPGRRRTVRGLHGALIALPPGASVPSPASSVALLASVDGPADGSTTTDRQPVTIVIVDASGDELRAEVAGDQRAAAAGLVARLDELLDTERAVLEARRGVAVAEAKRTVAALQAGRVALVGTTAPTSSSPSTAPDRPAPGWSVVVAADAERKAELLRRLRDHAAIDLRDRHVVEGTAPTVDGAPVVVGAEEEDDGITVDLRALGASS